MHEETRSNAFVYGGGRDDFREVFFVKTRGLGGPVQFRNQELDSPGYNRSPGLPGGLTAAASVEPCEDLELRVGLGELVVMWR